MTDKCSFYIDEYNSLRKLFHNEEEFVETKEDKPFKGKTALIGDSFMPSHNNRRFRLLGKYWRKWRILNKKIKYGKKYDIIFSNNIYKDGTGPECLKKPKEIKGFQR